ncbi:hypothetical protein [Hyunsoonleella rubra]|uniref:Class I SAM-dependent methyltransferase n=1 Tax=Hyunsoonleella rubra TaxID=1737062 RepID=A0ABW5T9F2_9FLAO
MIDLLYRMIYHLEELEWANVYHDSIRGKDWLTGLSLNVGRWAGSYTFFYILNRVLNDYQPKTIVEFGLGESSKFISAYLDNQLKLSSHTIVEESEDWKDSFSKRFTLSKRSTVKIAPLTKTKVNTHEVNSYGQITKLLDKKYDLYVIDGPLGSPNYSRYDIVEIAKTFDKDDDFIIIFDDHQRKGEQQTFKALKSTLKEKGMEIHTGIYRGNKEVAVLASKAYPFIGSL